MSTERDADLYMVQLLDQTDRYSDMVDLIKRVIASDPVLNSDQRSLLSISYKNIITARRNALRYLAGLLERDDTKASAYRLEQVIQIQNVILNELELYCQELIGLIDGTLLPAAAGDSDARLHYQKLKADFWRYISENKQGADRESAAAQARQAYDTALAIARADIPPYRPASLGLVLNYAVYLVEIAGERQEAIDLAKTTYEECALTIGNNSPDSASEAANVLQLLRDNVAVWSQGLH
jgi:14-3-3 protein epsilon